jgi:deoxyribonuclease IV
MVHFKTGLKLYTTDTPLIPDIQALDRFCCHFIELYVVPGSFHKTIGDWEALNTPYVIHAPHTAHGVNLARADYFEVNAGHLAETSKFADMLASRIIIVHGGNTGSIEETIRQLRVWGDPRIAVENKPRLGRKNNECIGWSWDEIQHIRDAGVTTEFVLDFCHADCAARSVQANTMEFLDGFMKLNPVLFHLSDRNVESVMDEHLNFGKGNFNIIDIAKRIPLNALVTLETPRDPARRLQDFIDDVSYLRDHLS